MYECIIVYRIINVKNMDEIIVYMYGLFYYCSKLDFVIFYFYVCNKRKIVWFCFLLRKIF